MLILAFPAKIGSADFAGPWELFCRLHLHAGESWLRLHAGEIVSRKLTPEASPSVGLVFIIIMSM